MRNVARWLRISALILLVAGASTWILTGASRGWTKTTVAVRWMDEVTGLEGIRYEKKFQAGLEFLGIAVVGAVSIALVSRFFERNRSEQIKNT